MLGLDFCGRRCCCCFVVCDGVGTCSTGAGDDVVAVVVVVVVCSVHRLLALEMRILISSIRLRSKSVGDGLCGILTPISTVMVILTWGSGPMTAISGAVTLSRGDAGNLYLYGGPLTAGYGW